MCVAGIRRYLVAQLFPECIPDTDVRNGLVVAVVLGDFQRRVLAGDYGPLRIVDKPVVCVTAGPIALAPAVGAEGVDSRDRPFVTGSLLKEVRVPSE